MELALIGLQNAGKTSFVNVVTTGAFNEDMIPTVGFNMRKVSKGKVSMKLWDLGGQPRWGCTHSCGVSDWLHGPAVINWCCLPYALLGLSLPGVTTRLVTRTYRLSSIEPCFDDCEITT
jgi:hypothetical protein